MMSGIALIVYIVGEEETFCDGIDRSESGLCVVEGGVCLLERTYPLINL